MKKPSGRFSLLQALLLSLFFLHIPLGFAVVQWQGPRTEIKNTAPAIIKINLKQAPPEVPKKVFNDLPVADLNQAIAAQDPEKASVIAPHAAIAKEEMVATVSGPEKNFRTSSPKSVAATKTTPAPKSALPKPIPKKEASPIATPPPMISPTLPPKPAESPKNIDDELRALRAEKQKAEDAKLKSFDSKKTPATLNNGTYSGGGDYFPDFKRGPRTYLNAFGHPEISFLAELKHKIRFTWSPIPSLRRQPGIRNRGKVVGTWGISIDAQGKLRDMVLLQSSGITAYDQEAKRAIAASAPFSNPAPFLLQADGMFHIACTFWVDIL